MANLTDLCRQLRLAHIAEYIGSQQDEGLRSLAEQLLAAELDGRRRAKLGKLVQQAGFPHLKTFEGYVTEHISFPQGGGLDVLRSLGWMERKENLLLMGAVGTGNYRKYSVMERFSKKPVQALRSLPRIFP